MLEYPVCRSPNYKNYFFPGCYEIAHTLPLQDLPCGQGRAALAPLSHSGGRQSGAWAPDSQGKMQRGHCCLVSLPNKPSTELQAAHRQVPDMQPTPVRILALRMHPTARGWDCCRFLAPLFGRLLIYPACSLYHTLPQF